MARKKLKDEEKKTRITVSIDNDVYESLEDFISKNDINRSALIEELLKEYIKKN